MRMINRPVKFLFALLLLLSGFTTIYTQPKPQQPIQRLVIRETRNQTELLSLDDDGSVRVIAALEDVSFGPRLGVDWEVPIVIDVAPSPAGTRVAFTAFTLPGTEAALFVVSLNPSRIQRFDAPGVASLEWSPMGDALLLTRESFYLGGDYRFIIPLPDISEPSTE